MPSHTTKSVPARRGRIGRPRKDDAVAIQALLLDAAAAEFLKRGFTNASIDEIVTSSGVSKTTIYRHFPGKEHLFRAAAARFSRRLYTDFSRVETKGRAVEDVLMDFSAAGYSDSSSAEIVAILRLAVAEADAFPELAHAIYQQRREMLAPLTNYLRQLDEQGILNIPWPEQAAFQFVAMATGGIRVLLVPESVIDFGREAWVRSAVQVFLNGYSRRAIPPALADSMFGVPVEARRSETKPFVPAAPAPQGALREDTRDFATDELSRRIAETAPVKLPKPGPRALRRASEHSSRHRS